MAKGYLLGGLRQYIPGDDGNPLYRGRISFFVAGSQTPAPVYKDMELTTSWGTSVPLEVNGLAGNSENGVWLKTDHLYLVKVETLSHYDDEGREVWKSEWQVDNVGYVAESSSGGSVVTQTTVQTIAELKALQPASANVVIVNGWYSYLDAGSPMVFKWNADATAEQDDGHWIVPTGYRSTGRWEQVLNEGEVDVRKFGAIPDTSAVLDSYIDDALSWATEPHVYSAGTGYKSPRTIVFAKAGEYRLTSSIDFTSYTSLPVYGSRQVPVVINDGVFFATSSSSVNITFGTAVRCLSTESLCTSGVDIKVKDYSMIEVNPAWWGEYACSVKGCVIVTDKNISNNVYFEDCIINVVRKLSGNVSLKNCIVSDRYFADGYDFETLNLTGCSFPPPTEWKDPYNWVKCKKINGDSHYDFCGLQTELTNLSIANSGGSLVIENARSLSGLFKANSISFRDIDYLNIYMDDLGNNNSLYFYRSSVNGSINSRGNYSVYAEGCKINCSMASGQASLIAKDCSIYSSIAFNEISLNDCSSSSSSTIEVNERFTAFGCSLYSVNGCNISIYDSSVSLLYETTSSVTEGSVSILVWNSVIANSVVNALAVTNESTSVCRIQWSNSTISNLTFTECGKTGSAYGVRNCTVVAADGRVFKEEYKVCGTFTRRALHSISCEIPNFLSFVALGEPSGDQSTVSCNSGEGVNGVANIVEDETTSYALPMLNSPTNSFVCKKNGTYYLYVYNPFVTTGTSYIGTAVFDVVR